MDTLKGELKIELGGREYILRPTFAGMAKIRSLSDRYEIDIVMGLSSFNYGAKEIAAIIYGGIYGHLGCKKDSEMPLTFEDVGEKIMKEGIRKFTRLCLDFMSQAVSGESIKDLEKKILQPTEKTTGAEKS